MSCFIYSGVRQMQPFVYTALPAKVIFGFGTLARVADEIRELGCRQAMILSTPTSRPRRVPWPSS